MRDNILFYMNEFEKLNRHQTSAKFSSAVLQKHSDSKFRFTFMKVSFSVIEIRRLQFDLYFLQCLSLELSSMPLIQKERVLVC